jgi:transcriptional regulator with XRE-family HTH domain
MSNTFAEALFALRRKRKKLQKEIALSAGIDPSYLAALESGRRGAPDKTLTKKLCDALAATVSERTHIENAAAHARLLRALSTHHEDVRGGPALLDIAEALPSLASIQIEALRDLVNVMQVSARAPEEETPM